MTAKPGVIPDLDRKGLRGFGLTTAAILAGLFGVLFPWLLERSTPVWPWVLAGALVLSAVIAPTTLGPVYKGWMRFGLLMGRITTPLILGFLFFLVITPFALVFHLLSRDPLSRRLDGRLVSYRVASRMSSKDKLERPF